MTRAHAGTIREHGPDCRGVGQPPVEPEAPLLAATPSPAEETAVESSTEPGATVEPASAPERGPMPTYDALETAYQEAEEWGYPADRPPTYTRLDEDDGEIDGGAVPLRAETSHRDLPAEFAEPSLLGPPQRSRVAQLEDEAGRRQIEDIEELRLEAGDLRVEVEGLERKLAGEEVLCDRLTREASTLREEVATLRATLSQALALIGRLSEL